MDTAVKHDGFAGSHGKNPENKSDISWLPASGTERREKRE